MDRRAAAVAVLLVLAGCSAFGGGAPSTDRPTLTPAPVPTEVSTPTDRPPLAPGLTSNGITDLDALVSAHVRVARNTSYVWRVHDSERQAFHNGTTLTQRVVYVDDSRYRHEVGLLPATIDGRRSYLQGYARYADGDDEYATWTASLSGETAYRHSEGPRANGRFARLAADPLLEYLVLRDVTVSRVSTENRTYYRVVGTRDTLLRYGDVENFRATALVRADGFVRQLNVSFATERADRRVDVRYNFTYDEIGTASLDRPAWVATARNETHGE